MTEVEVLARMARGSFRILVKDRQNATWQGTVIWTDTGEAKNFRSALELLKLIDSAMDAAE